MEPRTTVRRIMRHHLARTWTYLPFLPIHIEPVSLCFQPKIQATPTTFSANVGHHGTVLEKYRALFMHGTAIHCMYLQRHGETIFEFKDHRVQNLPRFECVYGGLADREMEVSKCTGDGHNELEGDAQLSTQQEQTSIVKRKRQTRTSGDSTGLSGPSFVKRQRLVPQDT